MNGHDEHLDRIWQDTSDWFHANSAVLNETYGVVLSYGIYRGSLLRMSLLILLLQDLTNDLVERLMATAFKCQ